MEMEVIETQFDVKNSDVMNDNIEENDSNIDMNEESRKHNRKSKSIRIDMNAIPCIENDEQEEELRALGITAYHQSIYEEAVMLQVDEALDEARDDHHSDHCLPQTQALHSVETRNQISPLDPKLCSISSKCLQFESIDELDNKRDDEITFGNEMIATSGKRSYNSSRDRKSCDYLSDSETNDKDINEDDEEWKPSDEDYNSEEQLEYDNNYGNSDSDIDIELDTKYTKFKAKRGKQMLRKSQTKAKQSNDSKGTFIRTKVIDDGNDKSFQKRIKQYKSERLLEKHRNIRSDGTEITNLDEMVKLDSAFQIPKRIWEQLFSYQQTGVKWLWELHQHGCGGIVGDEMGLGKTIQVIAFLCGLSCSRFHDFRDLFTTLGPVILVCPATVMHQWVAEFHKWWPYFRVAILHQTGSHSGKKETLIKAINRSNGILITSYSGVCSYQKWLLNYDWHYVILDEGHKIRNPEAQVTHACKMFNTPHRLILSGSPIQNNLRELWSLFDFVYPGKLGTLPVFMEHFAVPITQGGYANATQVQIQVAYKCATVLRDSIKPYLLRRMKDEVKSSLTLPSKNEQVLFCRLTEEQRNLYKTYLDSSTVREIIRGSTQIFVGLVNIRKICNHPNLFDRSSALIDHNNDYGYYKKSGKMIVVDALLRLWHNQKHKVLIFTQSRQMLRILENFVKYRSYSYLMMDGSTCVQSRQPMIKQFNEDPNIFVFLLTTRVGGIGVNLTGANRVLIYDPDWNPSTDVQARERCWRIGQNKQVTIYRLLSAGTVEEKIYHRQIFKQYLTNRVLKDPKQRRFFKTNDLHELFTLGSDSSSTESSAIFAGTDSDVKVNPKAKKLKTNRPKSDSNSTLPPEKVEELRVRAKMISKMIAEKFSNKEKTVENKCFAEEEEEVEEDCITDIKTNKNNNQINSKSDQMMKNKSKKEEKGIKFEGKRIKYLVKHDIYKELQTDKEKNNEDEYVLKKLFKKSKVHSALQHDVIECTTSPDFVLAEKEADNVAKQAINALKRSRELCSIGQSGVNSWSGLKPIANKSKFGQKRKLSSDSEKYPTSSSLMNAIKSRNKFESDSEENNSNMTDIPLSCEYDNLLADIRNYIAFQSSRSGEATTDELLNAFKSKLPPHQSAVFKSLLWQLCDFHRRSDKVGVWKLKVEFK